MTICGVRFSLGDDCIAVKSGKIYMGRRYKTPSSNIHVYQCLMEHGHGAVTVGSEMAGGVNNLIVEKCRFYHTDRGLRIKTRRGRGKDAILEEYADNVLPKVLTTVEESSRLSQIQPTISDIVDRYVADWVINGVTDESWETYKSELQSAGVEELVQIWQTAIDRAKGNV